MRPFDGKEIALSLLLLAATLPGCALFTGEKQTFQSLPQPQAARSADSTSALETAEIQQVSLRAPALAETETQPPESDVLPFADAEELSVDLLVQEVLSRNPSLVQMTAAWEAVSARYPQATALEDPMFATTVGPATIDSPAVEFACRVEVAQKLPYPGKRGLRGQAVQAQAAAAGSDVDDLRLQLVESAKSAFYDYYLIFRALEVNEEGLRLLGEFRQNAQTRYKTGQAPQQEVLQGDVEIGRERERRLTLERRRQVSAARLNTLMHMPPDRPLPPPPRTLKGVEPLPAARELRSLALARRPDLQALAGRIAAEEAALALAKKEFYPDFEPFFMYDRFMGNTTQTRDLAAMLGVKLNLPVYKAKRFAALAEAHARLAQRRAELERLTDQVNFEVEDARAQVYESEQSLELYRTTILPAAQENVKAAQAAYVTGKIPFLSLIEAQRDLVNLRDRSYESSADYYRRRAVLERVTGGP